MNINCIQLKGQIQRDSKTVDTHEKEMFSSYFVKVNYSAHVSIFLSKCFVFILV